MATAQQTLKTINTKFESSISLFKQYIINNISERPEYQQLIDKINEYKFPLIGYEDINRKKRMKNNIPICERCEAKRASGERCSRRKKGSSVYCGTHIKGTPHGKINDKQKSLKKVEITNAEINGIIYFIDNDGNVYDHEDIQHNKTNPRVLTRYSRNENGDIIINV
jgi:hypothetical protein